MTLTDIQKDNLQKLIDDLTSLFDTLDKIHYAVEKEKFYSHMDTIWEYIRNYDKEDIVQLFFHTDEFKVMKEKISSLELYYERALEVNESVIILSNILKDNSSYITEFTKNRFVINNYHTVKNELSILENKNPNTFVMVGSGPLPETILFLADNTDIQNIIGIDASPEAIAIAGDLIKNLGYQNRIQFISSYGEEYDYANADVVHIANSVHNKSKVLNQIAKTCKKGTEILVRVPFGLSALPYETVDELPSSLCKKKISQKSPFFKDHCILLEKFNY